ncbi:hypothetical protein KDA_74880 [Dictyobacter alpinus]|uniref:Uncharacterized protein n=1 Tax=Dictyobacter alpinus TaxID=2014873 RepID=A0A402BKY0_9CHLR|nr:hypothetical protein [Dictyobacter alpinus]GCE32004.1 hypothetical protein KDA_74880 [Dictyobacter alpinus]
MTLLPDGGHVLLGEAIPFSVGQGRDILEQFLSIIEMLQLYEECFPDQFQRDQEQGVSIFPESGHDYSECEVNFFRLVDEHYFPLPVDFLPDDLYGERRLMERIPIGEMGFDLYDEDQWQELPFGWKLLLYLLGTVDEEWFRAHGVYEDDDLFEIPVSRGGASEALLVKRCSAQGGALASLALAVQMLMNETDSVWLNVTMDDPCLDAMWTKEDMEEIRRQYHLGLEIRSRASCFCEWLEEDPVSHFALAARLWNSCARDTPRRGTGPRVMQVPAGTFGDGINFGELFGRHIALPERIGDAREP